MHILLLTDSFAPEVNAPANRGHEHAREWVKMGHKVTVITSVPNTSGRVFQGYRNRLWQSNEVDGIHVLRIWTFIAPNMWFVWRSLDYLSFMITALLASLFVRRVDVVVGTSPQFFTVWAAWAASVLRGIPFIFELRDLWPASISAVEALKNKRILRCLERLELFLYRRAALIVAVTHSFQKNLVARGINADKITVVTNGIDPDLFKPATKEPELEELLDLKNCFVAGYIGTHGMAHGLNTVLAAAEHLRDQPDIRFLIIGGGAESEALKATAAQMQLNNVCFIPPVAREKIAKYWSLLDCALVPLRDKQAFTEVLPSKLFEAMAMGVPVVLGVRGEAAELVRRHEIGVVITPEKPLEMARAILHLRANQQERETMRDNGIRTSARFNRRLLAAAMVHAIEDVASHAEAHLRHPAE